MKYKLYYVDIIYICYRILVSIIYNLRKHWTSSEKKKAQACKSARKLETAKILKVRP